MRKSNLYRDDENHLCAFMKLRIRDATSGNQKRRQAMSRNILLGYSGSLVGVPPSPRPTACASGRTRLSAWLYAPCGRLLLHIRAGEGRRILRRQEVSMTGKKFYSSESFLVPSFVMVSCPSWHFTVILSPAEKPAFSSHLPCKTICGGACL